MRHRYATSAFFAVLLALALPACGSASQPDPGARSSKGASVGLKQIGSFDHPVYVDGAPGYPKLLFVVEQPGRVVVLKNGRRAGTFLDLRSQVGYDGGERGLLSVAFPDDYAQSRSFYVYYNDGAGNIRVDEFKRGSATRAAAGSQRQVIEIPHPVNSNHNGGQLQFLDGLLYFGTGDGGSGGDPPNNAQNKDVLLGKLLRIDPSPSGGAPYSVPSSNPFVGKPGRDEIYSYGLRNPFRFSFDTVSAKQPRIAIGDVGQNQFEEVDYSSATAAGGANFGWDAFEGNAPYRDENSGTGDPGGTVKPILAYPHSRGGNSCSIIGGYVVADRGLPSLYKRYVYADYCEGQLRSLTPHLKKASGDRKLGLAVESPTSFGEDDAHHLYVSSQAGPVYRLVPR
ncbi:MAG TPA: PQQ-dependent sugar dehydrogenase [Solirubrobacterales bacterium]|jgi:glucose/arabinose dehydrogenase|nr:PQQ-dependent sugar dehydrogenase [Solirubrobacterales bacterium]